MRVLVVPFLALFAAIIAVHLPEPHVPPPAAVVQIDQQIEAAARVWKVVGEEGTGTAVPIGNVNGVWVFLSCQHVAEGCPARTLELRGRSLTVTRVELLPQRDLALLFAPGDGQDVPLVALAGRAARFGERVMAVGFGKGELTLTDGRVSERGNCSTAVIFGNSGGPLLDSEGRILGIIVRMGVMNFQVVCHQAQFEPLDGYELGWIRELAGLR